MVVFNTLGWPRTDLAEVTVGFSDRGVAGVTLTDAAGRDVPVQLKEAARYGDGGLKVARLAFLARDVPALGYSTYHVVPRRAGRAQEATPANRPVLENESYRVTLDPATGALTSLLVKAGKWEALRGPARRASALTAGVEIAEDHDVVAVLSGHEAPPAGVDQVNGVPVGARSRQVDLLADDRCQVARRRADAEVPRGRVHRRDALALKRDRWEPFDIEEVGAVEMRVALPAGPARAGGHH